MGVPVHIFRGADAHLIPLVACGSTFSCLQGLLARHVLHQLQIMTTSSHSRSPLFPALSSQSILLMTLEKRSFAPTYCLHNSITKFLRADTIHPIHPSPIAPPSWSMAAGSTALSLMELSSPQSATEWSLQVLVGDPHLLGRMLELCLAALRKDMPICQEVLSVEYIILSIWGTECRERHPNDQKLMIRDTPLVIRKM